MAQKQTRSNKLQITVLFGTLILYWKILKRALHCREMK